MNQTILITGIGGFAGSHLYDLLRARNSTTKIVGLIHPTDENIYLPEEPPQLHKADILEYSSLKAAIFEIRPDAVFHLAGLAHVKESWTNRKQTIETNFLGSLNLLEACRELPAFPKVLLVGSAECYGRVDPDDQPICETHPLAPASPYAVSKIAQEMLAVQYARSEKLPVYITRSFNHTGPRQKETFVCSAFARQIALTEAGLAPAEIVVGNLSARRDFSDVRDVAAAYVTIVESGQRGEPYNVCSGQAYSIREVLDTLLSLSPVKFKVTVDAERFRPSDLPLLLGSAEKLQAHTKWRPQFSLAQTLHDLLDDWRLRIQRQAAL